MNYIDGEMPGTQRYNWPTVFGCNTLYFVVLVLMILLSGAVGLLRLRLEDTELWLAAAFVMEVLVIGVPPLLYLLIRKMNIRQIVRLNKIEMKELMLVFGMAVFSYGIVSFINLIWHFILSSFGTPVVPELPPINNRRQYMTALFVMALTPALVEEFLFRGVIIRGYESFGAGVSIAITGVLFAFLHLRLTNIPAIIFLGIMIGYVVVRTNSIFAGVLYHFVQNAISISLLYIQQVARDYLQGAGTVQADMSSMPPEFWIAAVMVWGLIATFSLVFFLLFAVALHRTTRLKADIGHQMALEKRKPNLKEMLPIVGSGVIVAVMLCIEIITMTGGS